jgi:hypothetical protein
MPGVLISRVFYVRYHVRWPYVRCPYVCGGGRCCFLGYKAVQSGGKLTEKYGGSKLGEENGTFLWQFSKFLLPDCTLEHPIRQYFPAV